MSKEALKAWNIIKDYCDSRNDCNGCEFADEACTHTSCFSGIDRFEIENKN